MAKKNTAPRKLPTKKSINLVAGKSESINMKAGLPAIIVIVLLAALLGKVAVVDRYSKMYRAVNKADRLQTQVDEAYRTIQSFGEMQEEYAHYTYENMTDEEINGVKRTEIMEMIERIVMPQANVGSVTISGYTVTFPVSGVTLQEANQLSSRIENDPLVDFCTVTTATTNTNPNLQVTAQITIYLNY